MRISIDPSKLQDVKCQACSKDLFEPRFQFKRLSHLQSPSGRTEFLPRQFFVCSGCGAELDLEDKKEKQKSKAEFVDGQKPEESELLKGVK